MRGLLRREEGSAMVTVILVVATMLALGTAMLGIVNAQSQQVRQERSGETAFNLAEAALNAQAFLLGRNWPTTAVAGTCSSLTVNGTLTDPATTTTRRDQIQSILAQTYDGNATGSQWWVTTCAEGGRSSWDASILGGAAYDTTFAADPEPQPRRMWVRAEARVDGHRRAVVALVQAGQAPVFPANLAVVTGKMGADLTTTSGQLLTGGVVGPLLGTVLGGSDPMIVGGVGLRCSLLDNTELLGCLNGLYKATSMTTVAPLLQANDYVDFRSDTTISAEQLALLRQEAQASGTYYPKNSAGVGTVAANASCLPIGSAGKVIFIEKVGDGTGHCLLSTAGGASAKALIVGSGGVRVTGGGTFTGVIYALHQTALSDNDSNGVRDADIRIENGSKVVGGAFADDNAALGVNSRGMVEVKPPPINMNTVLCRLVSPLVCALGLTSLLAGTLDDVISSLNISAETLAAAIVPELTASFPAIVYDEATVDKVTTFGDSQTVTGTFRQVAPAY